MQRTVTAAKGDSNEKRQLVLVEPTKTSCLFIFVIKQQFVASFCWTSSFCLLRRADRRQLERYPGRTEASNRVPRS